MDSLLYRIAQAGFILLTLAFISLFVREFQSAIRLTGWDAAQKKNYLTRIIASLILWAAFVTLWLPGFLVPLAYYLHFLSFRQVAQR